MKVGDEMDREHIIKRFADYVYYFKAYCTSDADDHEMLKAVLSLLKEQEAVVRCCDCEHWDSQCHSCEHFDGIMQPDFYCADGVKRDD